MRNVKKMVASTLVISVTAAMFANLMVSQN